MKINTLSLMIVGSFVLSSAFIFTGCGNIQPTPQGPTSTTGTTTTNNQPPANINISIMVPNDQEKYITAVNNYINNGGKNPVATWPFIKKELTIPYHNDGIMASAQAAAEVISPPGGPAKANVIYLKIQNEIAYVVLDIDEDAWAGASRSYTLIHPLVEKTLLQFPSIKKSCIRTSSRR
jgi:hypothetical protein